jgi:aminoglycoside phosphotransferase (APT) family kinase protein
VTATRAALLRDAVAGFDLHGLPEPLARLPALLNESVAGTQSTIHGDLNLENILVGPGGFVWLIDFAQTRDGHPLYDFAHLEAEVIAHVVAAEMSPADYVGVLSGAPHALLSTLHQIAARCLFNPAQPREYDLALYAACLGALKFPNLDRHQRHLLYLTAAHLSQSL